MGKLQDYYRLFDMFKGQLTNEQKAVLEGLEDQLITDEILPAISESVAPVLSALRRPLTLVVDYDPEGGITVKTTRGAVVVKEKTAKKYEIPSTSKVIKVAEADDKHHQHDVKTKQPITRSESIGFTVRFDDGTIVRCKDAKDTLIESLRVIGFNRAAAFKGVMFKGFPLVGKKKRTDGIHKWQEQVDGWYVYINMSNNTKIKVLCMVAQEFGVNLTIEKNI